MQSKFIHKDFLLLCLNAEIKITKKTLMLKIEFMFVCCFKEPTRFLGKEEFITRKTIKMMRFNHKHRMYVTSFYWN